MAAKCHQPMTFVDVPVDTVTFYLPPVARPGVRRAIRRRAATTCRRTTARSTGELVWPRRASSSSARAWSSVPAAGRGRAPGGVRVQRARATPIGIVLHARSVDGDDARLERSSSATRYTLAAVPGQPDGLRAGRPRAGHATPGTRVRLRALRDGRRPGRRRCSPTRPTTGVDIPMTTLLDRALTTVPAAAPPAPAGPDRLAVDAGHRPRRGRSTRCFRRGRTTNLLPISGSVAFVGVPALDSSLVGAQYDLDGVGGRPGSARRLSDVRRSPGIETTDANDPITVGGFFAIPTLVEPPDVGVERHARAAPGDRARRPRRRRVVVRQRPRGRGRSSRPGTDLSFDLPDLSQVPGVEQLRARNVITTSFAIARITGFQYGDAALGPARPIGMERLCTRTSRSGSY